MSQFIKKWEDLNFSDNFIFCKVMRNKDLCKQMLEILLGIKIREIKYIDTEHSYEEFYETRGIRMDVYLEGDDKVYDLEMQTGNYNDLPIRARYYLAASDIASTPRRTKFKDLKETFIIFICKDDPFGAGLPRYTEYQYFKETNKVPYDDKSHKIFYNASAFAKAENKDIREVLEFIYTLKAETPFTKTLEHCANNAKVKPLFRNEYMYFMDILEDEKEKARDEAWAGGLAEGRAEGIETKAIEDAVLLVKKYNINPEQAAKDFNVDLEKLNLALSK